MCPHIIESIKQDIHVLKKLQRMEILLYIGVSIVLLTNIYICIMFGDTFNRIMVIIPSITLIIVMGCLLYAINTTSKSIIKGKILIEAIKQIEE